MKYTQEQQRNLRALIAISRNSSAIHRRSSRIFREEGLSLTQFAVLEALYHKGCLSISQLIESLLATGGNVTVVVRNLQKLGLLEYRTSEQDRRVRMLEITDAGREVIERIFPRHLKDLSEHFSVLTEEEKEQLITLLKKLSRRD